MTVTKLESLVKSGQLRYVLVNGTGGFGRGGSNDSVTTWITQHGTAVTGAGVGSGGTLYELSS